MDYFPLFFKLKNQPILIVGGGTIATRKARLVNKAGAIINVVSPDIQPELRTLCEQSGGVYTAKEYTSSDISDCILVISATENDQVNAAVADDCHQLKLPVNVVDSPDLCSVITPAIVDRDPLTVAVSSGGQSPVLTRKIRSQIERSLPAAIGDLGKLANRYRDQVKHVFTDEDSRRRFWEVVLEGEIAETFLKGNPLEAETQLQSLLEKKQVSEGGEVYLVGAGPGDPELLTFKALRLMQQAEVVLYDRLVAPEIIEMTRRDAERVYVGKKRSHHAVPQQEINKLLLDYAQQGKRVLRLKGGDPFIFGRGGEEIELLAEHNIPFQVVPGVTAASGCSSYAGIPLTHRDYSQSVRFITGHLKQLPGEETPVLEHPWEEFRSDNQTLVFYMGLISLPIICKQLILHGKDSDTPAALVEKGTQAAQRVHIGTISSLPEIIESRDVKAPTLLIIGNVVELHDKLKWFKK